MGSLEPDRAGRQRILFIDAFDSFTNNIVGLLEQSLDADVTLVHINDQEVDGNFTRIVEQYDAVVVGPGPGHPAKPEDVGFIGKLWTLGDEHMLPVLGICLGFQSLCMAQGADVRQLTRARHGIVNSVTHQRTDIFSDIDKFEATQYHSLRVDIRHVAPEENGPLWSPSDPCPLLRPLAWDMDDEINGPILMAVRHAEKPFWGVQFHPESICTSPEGKTLVQNWWTRAQDWARQKGRQPAVRGRSNVSKASDDAPDAPGALEVNGEADRPTGNGRTGSHLADELRSICGPNDVFLRWGRHPASMVTPTRLMEALGQSHDETILLDSQGHASGRYSILGITVPGKTMKVTYKVSSKELQYGLSPGRTYTSKLVTIEEVWPILQEALDQHNPRGDPRSRASTPGDDLAATGMDRFVAGHLPEDSPFWGGFMGYISYEAGLETLDVDLHESCAASEMADINFAFIHRSIVFDHEASQIYIQSLLPGDWTWILNTGRVVNELVSQAEAAAVYSAEQEEPAAKRPKTNGATEKLSADLEDEAKLNMALSAARIERPLETSYRGKVLRCQDVLASGDSYELCLTDETEITIPCGGADDGLDSWALYKRLRRNNPAPFGAFMRLSGVSVVGSSPERFLRWTRDGRCQFRPIKGTVKKGPEMTRERAHAILGSSKERAENLMIVDLIRHDLSGVIGAEKTWVSKLMVVEEYETVYQLVSVIEGQLPEPAADAPRGIHVLKASLPPGSMTGAPKKRSCEILRDIEARPRGIYSGVLGYMDVGGAGDFSVVIRTAVCTKAQQDEHRRKNGSGDARGDREIWRVGAGGAVTIQSTDEGEFQEMEAKQSSVLGSLLHQKEK